MTDQTDQEAGAGKEEIASAQNVMLALVKTAKGLRMYLPNNPVLISFVEELNAKMAAHLSNFGTLQIDVEPFSLRYKGAEIYENRDPKESLACRLHADGIRMLLFEDGVDARELMALLGIVGFERPTNDDDVVTQLWERSLAHISYLLEEDFMEGEAADEGEGGVVSQQEALSRIHAAVAEHPPVSPKMVPKHLLMLTGEEEKWLRTIRQAEARRNGLDDVVSILIAILAGTREPELFKEFVAIMTNLTNNMFLGGEVGHALRQVRFLDTLQRLESTPAERRELLARALTDILNDSTVQVLQEVLDSGDTISHDELKEILHMFGLPSLKAICELLGRVEKLKVRKSIIEVLVELGRANPSVFTPFLSDPRWYLVRNMVLVLSLLGTQVALEMIVQLISHREPRIRREVLGFLERSNDPKAKSYLVKYLRDDSSALRIKALQIMGREKVAIALKPILALTATEEFRHRDPTEKKAVYEALGELGGLEVVPVFRDMLLKKYWFQKTSEKDGVSLAVAGLLKMPKDRALNLLEEARSVKRTAEVKAVLDQAFASLTSKGKTA